MAKIAAGENGAGEKLRRQKIGAGDPSKFAATNARRQKCRGVLLRRETNFEVAKFKVIFEGSHCTVAVGGEKRTEIFSPPETLCLQARKCQRKIHHKFHHPKSALAMPLQQYVVLSTFFNVSPPFTHSRNKWDLSVSS